MPPGKGQPCLPALRAAGRHATWQCRALVSPITEIGSGGRNCAVAGAALAFPSARPPPRCTNQSRNAKRTSLRHSAQTHRYVLLALPHSAHQVNAGRAPCVAYALAVCAATLAHCGPSIRIAGRQPPIGSPGRAPYIHSPQPLKLHRPTPACFGRICTVVLRRFDVAQPLALLFG
jgi:hypothetical protein